MCAGQDHRHSPRPQLGELARDVTTGRRLWICVCSQMLTAAVVPQEPLLVQEVDTEAFWFGPAVLNIHRYFKNQRIGGCAVLLVLIIALVLV